MDIKLAVGLMSYEFMRIETVACLLKFFREFKHPVKFFFIKGTYVHDGRNKIVRDAQQMGATHLMFIDSDMFFPPDGVDKLLADDKDVVGAHYNGRQLPLISTIIPYDLNDKRNEHQIIKLREQKWEMPQETFRVYAVPTGFMLIKMSVFDKLEEPWFFHKFLGKKEDGDNKELGDDVYFCDLCKKAGIDVWCNPHLNIKHIGSYMY